MSLLFHPICLWYFSSMQFIFSHPTITFLIMNLSTQMLYLPCFLYEFTFFVFHILQYHHYLPPCFPLYAFFTSIFSLHPTITSIYLPLYIRPWHSDTVHLFHTSSSQISRNLCYRLLYPLPTLISSPYVPHSLLLLSLSDVLNWRGLHWCSPFTEFTLAPISHHPSAILFSISQTYPHIF